MGTRRLTTLVILGVMLPGCQPLPQDASRTFPPGRASDVAHGVNASAAGAGDGFHAPRVLPPTDLPVGSIPVIEPPNVIHVWFFPTVSHDGYAFREGFWCHRVIRTFAWGAARAMAELSVPLTGSWPADDEGDPDGDASGDDMSGRIEPQPAFLDSLQDLGHESAPYAPVRTRDPVPQPDRAPDPHATSTHPAGR